MDIEQTYGINAKRSIYIVGVTNTDTDDDIIVSLQTIGTVAKVVRLQNTECANTAIAEFDSEMPLAVLELNFPLQIPNVNDATVTWHVDSVNTLTYTTS